MISSTDITAVVIAGGKGSRLGGLDKGLMLYNDQPFVATIITRIQAQVANIAINANRNQAHYAQYNHPVFGDMLSDMSSDLPNDYQGPLAGFVSAMQQVRTPYIITVPCDAPCLPHDLVSRLCHAQHKQQTEIAIVHDGEHSQFLHALLPVSLQGDLLNFLQDGKRSVGQWYQQHSVALVDFSDQPHAFMNINTDEQYQQLECNKDD